METTLIAVPTAVAVAAGGKAVQLQGQLRAERRRSAKHERRRMRGLRAVEDVLDQIAYKVVPSLRAAAALPGPDHGADLVLPDDLSDAVARRVTTAVASIAESMRRVQYDAMAATEEQLAALKAQGDDAADAARAESDESAQAAVRSFADSLVVTASKVSRQISEGVRRHVGGEAYETLVTIDRLVQQLLLVAQSYVVLGGGTLARRWPHTTFTDVVQAALGHLEGFERVKADESEVALDSRVVGPAVHAIAVLLDNALKYSPSSAFVEVRLVNGHHGMTVRIDDAGLQMNREAVASAHQILSGGTTQTVTALGAHPQTGFAVTGRLARRYGFSVDLEAPNSYRGTTVQIFFPKELLAHVPDGPRAAEPPSAAPPLPHGTTINGLTRRQRATASPQRAKEPSDPVEPGRSSVVAAWAAGTRRARHSSPSEGA
ncbi:ATP-binding protein (plasmid) [Streptomyces sp. NBC_01281]|uniref:ATP-binding protein n=1 Tax=Streptomyces sp. NBC_01281 TaxID=2903811 RepID=UPI002E145A5E|nr:ATP-binding protein [Streptomyces sp. NBC_01281]